MKQFKNDLKRGTQSMPENLLGKNNKSERRSLLFAAVITLLLLCNLTTAQVFMVVKDGVSTPYNDLETAVNEAEEGSTVYIPSGVFVLRGSPIIEGAARANTLLIDKRLTIYGAGANEGSLNSTVIQGRIALTTTASGSILEGFSMIQINTGNPCYLFMDNVSNVIIKRCRMSDSNSEIRFSGQGSGNIIRECIFYTITHSPTFFSSNVGFPTNGTYTKAFIQNNVIAGRLNYIKEMIIINNVITFSGIDSFSNIHYTTVSNNIFTANITHSTSTAGSSHNNYTFNLLVGSFLDSPAANYNTIDFNIQNVPINNIFIDQVRYHLLPDCLGVGAGSDETDMGIYGGAIPAKEKRIPNVPSFTQFSIGGVSTLDGTLKVGITVEAQDE